mmetsp:Transcript_688/g.823  ORF Transcript_688/g.823 Transcript_688/m.823 type:complete len:193 (-) Transcript_688:50-628(-)
MSTDSSSATTQRMGLSARACSRTTTMHLWCMCSSGLDTMTWSTTVAGRHTCSGSLRLGITMASSTSWKTIHQKVLQPRQIPRHAAELLEGVGKGGVYDLNDSYIGRKDRKCCGPISATGHVQIVVAWDHGTPIAYSVFVMSDSCRVSQYRVQLALASHSPFGMRGLEFLHRRHGARTLSTVYSADLFQGVPE